MSESSFTESITVKDMAQESHYVHMVEKNNPI